MKELLGQLPWSAVIFLCLTLGLAPYWPPHIFEKLSMLVRGKLVRPVDWFDLILHSSPWIILILKALLYESNKGPTAP
ncbi:MAG: RND transporter [Nitrospiraceae bacterium]|nr:MAG: RND transporter [Nitrospiraceae bacterium]